MIEASRASRPSGQRSRRQRTAKIRAAETTKRKKAASARDVHARRAPIAAPPRRLQRRQPSELAADHSPAAKARTPENAHDEGLFDAMK